MKTFLMIYVLAFVSIIVLYVYDHNSVEAQPSFDPREAVAAIRRFRPAPDDFETEGTAASPDPVTVAPEKGSNDPEPPEEDELNTFEGLDQRIAWLCERVQNKPVLNLEIAEAYHRKAQLYSEGMDALRVLAEQASDKESEKHKNRLAVFENKRIGALQLAIRTLNKLPRNIYGARDVRWLKATVYADLPGQIPLAVTELRRLADDPEADPALREKARREINKYEK